MAKIVSKNKAKAVLHASGRIATKEEILENINSGIKYSIATCKEKTKTKQTVHNAMSVQFGWTDELKMTINEYSSFVKKWMNMPIGKEK